MCVFACVCVCNEKDDNIQIIFTTHTLICFFCHMIKVPIICPAAKPARMRICTL